MRLCIRQMVPPQQAFGYLLIDKVFDDIIRLWHGLKTLKTAFIDIPFALSTQEEGYNIFMEDIVQENLKLGDADGAV